MELTLLSSPSMVGFPRTMELPGQTEQPTVVDSRKQLPLTEDSLVVLRASSTVNHRGIAMTRFQTAVQTSYELCWLGGPSCVHQELLGQGTRMS